MIDDFDDGLSEHEQAEGIKEMLFFLECDELDDAQADQAIWDHAQGIGF